MTVARKKALRNTETSESSENGENSRNENENSGSNFAKISYIQYLIIFQKQSILVLFDFKSEVNVIHPILTKKLGLSVRLTDIGV